MEQELWGMIDRSSVPPEVYVDLILEYPLSCSPLVPPSAMNGFLVKINWNPMKITKSRASSNISGNGEFQLSYIPYAPVRFGQIFF